MTTRLKTILTVLLLAPVVSGCAAAALGAGGAVAADRVAEDNGGNLF